eukprot:scaffold9929_cov22-Cyclotella_meneghiniana.AAC.2
MGDLAIFDRQFPISSGILRTLMRSYNVTVTNSWNAGTPLRVQNFLENDEIVSPFAMASREHAIKWKHLFVSPEDELTSRQAKKKLKIVIVNRPASRQLLNAIDARYNLASAFPEHDVFEHHLNGTLQEMIGKLALETRMANTGNNMCPSMEKLVSAVDELIRKRQDCLDLT